MTPNFSATACTHPSAVARSCPEAVKGIPELPIAPPDTGLPEACAVVGLVSPAFFDQGVVGTFTERFWVNNPCFWGRNESESGLLTLFLRWLDLPRIGLPMATSLS